MVNGNNQNANISIIADPNKLPNFDLEFDGIPKPDFLRQFWRSFENNLGTIVQDGYTLLDCLNQDDAGAGPGTNGGAGNAAQQTQNATRKRRLFQICLKYTSKHCHFYSELQTYQTDGRLAALYLKAFGQLQLAPADIEKLQNEWANLNCTSLKIPVGNNMLYTFMNSIFELSEKFVPPKTPQECYIKFLNGCPEYIAREVMDERDRMNGAVAPGFNATYTFPAVYPMTHPLNGNAHPSANMPDVRALCTAFTRRITFLIEAGVIRTQRAAPAVFSVDVDSDDEDYCNWVAKPRKQREIDR